MIVEAGHYALVLAFALSLVLAIVPLWGAAVRDQALMAVARPASFALFVMVAISYGALTAAYVGSDFSVMNVVQNSHSLKPLAYKISGVWANHEGSMLLWVLILALFAGLVALRGGRNAGAAGRQRAGRSGRGGGRIPAVHPAHLESVRAGLSRRRSRGRA